MRIIHTADVHLDHSFAADFGPSGHGRARREAIRTAFRSLVDRCLAWPADALLIAGDLFDAGRVTPDTLAFLRGCFADLNPIPVVIAPGRSDPYSADSPYARYPWPANVRIFLAPSWQFFEFDAPALTVHGFAQTNAAGAADTLELSRDGRVHIALAHDAAAGELNGKGIAYGALGGGTEPASYVLEDGAAVHRPGPLEALGFEDGPRGHYIEAELTPDGVSVTVYPRSSALYMTGDLGEGDAGRLAAELVASIPAGAGPVFGRFTVAAADADRIRAAAGPSFALLDVSEREDNFDASPPVPRASIAGRFVERMDEAIARAGSDAERALAVRARRLGFEALMGGLPPYTGAGST